MKHTFQEDREIDEPLVADCRTADEWIRKTKNMSKAEWRSVRAYLRAKQNYLDKVDAILDIRTERGEDKAAA
jgi:hypothetical protein